MSVFFDNSITDSGRLLWAEMQAGGTFEATKIVIGSGYMPSGKTTKTMTAVATPVQEITLNKKKSLGSGDFVFGGIFTNKDITSAFYYRELGLYAKVTRADGTATDEILYSYGNAGDNAEVIPAYSTDTIVERQLDIITYIGNDATVNLEVSSGLSVSWDDFYDEINRIDELFDQISTDSSFLLPADGWGEDKTQTVTVAGVTATMKAPIIDVLATTEDEDTEWLKIWRVEILDGQMKFYAREIPMLDLTVRYKVVM